MALFIHSLHYFLSPLCFQMPLFLVTILVASSLGFLNPVQETSQSGLVAIIAFDLWFHQGSVRWLIYYHCVQPPMASILFILRGWICLLTFLEVEFQTLLARAGNLFSFCLGAVRHGCLRYSKSWITALHERIEGLVSPEFQNMQHSCRKIHVE